MELPSSPRSLQEGLSTAERLTAQQIAQVVFHPGQTIHRVLDSMSVAAGMPVVASVEATPSADQLAMDLEQANQLTERKKQALSDAYEARSVASGRIAYYLTSRLVSRREAGLCRLTRERDNIAAQLQNQQ